MRRPTVPFLAAQADPRPAELQIELNGEDVLEPMVKTGCCGARLYLRMNPTFCPLCDRPISGTVIALEKDLSHLIHTSTRYWS